MMTTAREAQSLLSSPHHIPGGLFPHREVLVR